MLIESPNVSEGRRLEVVDRLAAAIGSTPDVFLLDRTSDASHNRSVFTMAGEHGPVSAALDRLVAAAIHEIDMDAHEGEHPRIGAVDVIPFIPLGSTSMDDVIDLAARSVSGLPAGSTFRSISTRAPPSAPTASASPMSDEVSTRGSRPRSGRTAGTDFGPAACTRRPARWPSARARS